MWKPAEAPTCIITFKNHNVHSGEHCFICTFCRHTAALAFNWSCVSGCLLHLRPEDSCWLDTVVTFPHPLNNSKRDVTTAKCFWVAKTSQKHSALKDWAFTLLSTSIFILFLSSIRKYCAINMPGHYLDWCWDRKCRYIGLCFIVPMQQWNTTEQWNKIAKAFSPGAAAQAGRDSGRQPSDWTVNAFPSFFYFLLVNTESTCPNFLAKHSFRH